MAGQQASTSLSKLPLELRRQIFRELFASTVFEFPARTTSSPTAANAARSRNRIALSILKASKEIRAEASRFWLSCSLFSFGNTERFLDVLSALPTATLSQLRHVLIQRAYPICFLNEAGNQFQTHHFQDALTLLPGLQLDRLTLGDIWHFTATRQEDNWYEFGSEHDADRKTYKMIERLVRQGQGWRELRVYSPTTACFTWRSAPDNGLNGDRLQNFPLPRSWSRTLRERDGSGSDAEPDSETDSESGSGARPGPASGSGSGSSSAAKPVRIFVAKQLGEAIPTWLATDPELPSDTQPFWRGIWRGRWEKQDRKTVLDAQADPEGLADANPESPDPDALDEYSILAILRRAKHADITQRDPPSAKLVEDMRHMTWAEVQKEGFYWDPSQDLTAVSY